ncbi:phage tail protein [Longimicrobium sp.]|uniref:phage tail protein n=1 Tax=Longimicrobium sp. TaxID=2029185 RepID=UPI002E3527E9|nr:phage tail protein [Longimicrobium sp.]HEX6038198.1 phage tail protein [Longimicrobium sp.]
MDANGQRTWLLADETQWHRGAGIHWDAARRSLRLSSRRTRAPRTLPADENRAGWKALEQRAHTLLDAVPDARDAHGTWARWEPGARRIVVGGAQPGIQPLMKLWAPHVTATDLAVGFDGVLYVAADGEILVRDPRGRMKSERVHRLGFSAWRVAPDPAGGAWALDRAGRALAHTEGQLWPDRPWHTYDGDVFRPDPENPRPPHLRLVAGLTWDGEAEEAAGIAASPGGRVALLFWRKADGLAVLRFLDGDSLSGPVLLDRAYFAYSLAWLSEDRIAVLVPQEKPESEALAYDVPGADALPAADASAAVLQQVGDVYPLRGFAEGPFIHAPAVPPHYSTYQQPGSRPLHRLSLPGFAPRGEAMNLEAVDSGVAGTVWHRLFVEAALPPRCGIVLHLAATETYSTPADDAEWFAHRFGDAEADDAGAPRGAWMPVRSEIPFHPGLLKAEPQRDRAGVFTALVQRGGRRVRALRGRYLWVRAELTGDGLATPELAAVRVQGSRFSYRDQYLPELYHEQEFGDDADVRADRSTPADFLDRFLANFEGVLTGIEDRVAHAHLLTDPRTVPAESLEWLASWIGTGFDAALPVDRRRALLAAAPELAGLRGTVHGLRRVLDICTGGAVRGGEIVVLEDFRLRRTFATILGADLADEDDPLLGGIADSGNSYVGDTLFLGDERRREFLALYDAELPVTGAEAAAVARLFDQLAHRVTVLVHQEIEPQDLGLIRRIVEREVPAHVAWRVMAASRPLMVGVASLVGVDTYLGRKPARTPVRVDRSRVGIRDYVLGAQSLDPRLEGGAAAQRPVARFSAQSDVRSNAEPIVVDASPSSAPPGRTLEGFRWTVEDGG